MTRSLVIGFIQLALVCGLAFGCTVEVGEEEPTGNVEQESNVTWTTHSLSSLTVGMALSDGEGFQWLSNSVGCRSSALSDPCGGTAFFYSVPGNDFAAIRGIGRAKNTGHIFAWYSDSTVTEGTASNFTAFSGHKNPFAAGLRHNRNALFSMDELVEVDNSDNGLWYYYWRDSSDNTFWRTTGTSVNAGNTAAQVTVSGSHGQIVGIAFGPGSPAPVETFYADGTLNISHTSLDIAN